MGAGHRRRRRLHAALGAIAIAAAAAAGASAGAIDTREVPAQWDVAGVAANGRAIDLFFNSGGCDQGARATARETATSVTLTVVKTVPGAPDAVCTADYRRGTVRAALAAPLGGRAIRGRPVSRGGLSLQTRVPGGVELIRVPRLVGLSPWEARRALRLRKLKVRVRTTPRTGMRTQVLGQAPAAGRAIERGKAVRIRIGLP